MESEDNDDDVTKQIQEYYKKYSQDRKLPKYFSGTSVEYMPKIVGSDEIGLKSDSKSEKVDDKSQGDYEDYCLENKPISPSSSVTSNRKLEWDNGADIGYSNYSKNKLYKSNSLPALLNNPGISSKDPGSDPTPIVTVINLSSSSSEAASSNREIQSSTSSGPVPTEPSVLSSTTAEGETEKPAPSSSSSSNFSSTLAYLKSRIGMPGAESTPKFPIPVVYVETPKPVKPPRKLSKRKVQLCITKPINVECIDVGSKSATDKITQTSLERKCTKSVQTSENLEETDRVLQASSSGITNQSVVLVNYDVSESDRRTSTTQTADASEALASQCDSFEYLYGSRIEEEVKSFGNLKRSEAQRDLVTSNSSSSKESPVLGELSLNVTNEDMEKNIGILKKLLKSKKYDPATKKRYVKKIVKKIVEKDTSTSSSELFVPKQPESNDSELSNGVKIQQKLQQNVPWYPVHIPRNLTTKTFSDEFLPGPSYAASPSRSPKKTPKSKSIFTMAQQSKNAAGSSTSGSHTSLEKQQDSSSQEYRNWKEEKTMSERVLEERKGRGDQLVHFAQKERQHQIEWINDEISHLSKLKGLLEKKYDGIGGGVTRTTTVYVVSSSQRNSPISDSQRPSCSSSGEGSSGRYTSDRLHNRNEAAYVIQTSIEGGSPPDAMVFNLKNGKDGTEYMVCENGAAGAKARYIGDVEFNSDDKTRTTNITVRARKIAQLEGSKIPTSIDRFNLPATYPRSAPTTFQPLPCGCSRSTTKLNADTLSEIKRRWLNATPGSGSGSGVGGNGPYSPQSNSSKPGKSGLPRSGFLKSDIRSHPEAQKSTRHGELKITDSDDICQPCGMPKPLPFDHRCSIPKYQTGVRQPPSFYGNDMCYPCGMPTHAGTFSARLRKVGDSHIMPRISEGFSIPEFDDVCIPCGMPKRTEILSKIKEDVCLPCGMPNYTEDFTQNQQEKVCQPCGISIYKENCTQYEQNKVCQPCGMPRTKETYTQDDRDKVCQPCGMTKQPDRWNEVFSKIKDAMKNHHPNSRTESLENGVSNLPTSGTSKSERRAEETTKKTRTVGCVCKVKPKPKPCVCAETQWSPKESGSVEKSSRTCREEVKEMLDDQCLKIKEIIKGSVYAGMKENFSSVSGTGSTELKVMKSDIFSDGKSESSNRSGKRREIVEGSVYVGTKENFPSVPDAGSIESEEIKTETLSNGNSGSSNRSGKQKEIVEGSVYVGTKENFANVSGAGSTESEEIKKETLSNGSSGSSNRSGKRKEIVESSVYSEMRRNFPSAAGASSVDSEVNKTETSSDVKSGSSSRSDKRKEIAEDSGYPEMKERFPSVSGAGRIEPEVIKAETSSHSKSRSSRHRDKRSESKSIDSSSTKAQTDPPELATMLCQTDKCRCVSQGVQSGPQISTSKGGTAQTENLQFGSHLIQTDDPRIASNLMQTDEVMPSSKGTNAQIPQVHLPEYLLRNQCMCPCPSTTHSAGAPQSQGPLYDEIYAALRLSQTDYSDEGSIGVQTKLQRQGHRCCCTIPNVPILTMISDMIQTEPRQPKDQGVGTSTVYGRHGVQTDYPQLVDDRVQTDESLYKHRSSAAQTQRQQDMADAQTDYPHPVSEIVQTDEFVRGDRGVQSDGGTGRIIDSHRRSRDIRSPPMRKGKRSQDSNVIDPKSVSEGLSRRQNDQTVPFYATDNTQTNFPRNASVVGQTDKFYSKNAGAQSDLSKNYTMQTDNPHVFDHVIQTENVPSKNKGSSTGNYRNNVGTEYPGVTFYSKNVDAQSDPNKNYSMQTDNPHVFEHVIQTENAPSKSKGSGTGSYRNNVATEYPGVAFYSKNADVQSDLNKNHTVQTDNPHVFEHVNQTENVPSKSKGSGTGNYRNNVGTTYPGTASYSKNVDSQSDPHKNYTMQTDNAHVFEHVIQTENVPSNNKGSGTGNYRNSVGTEYPGIASYSKITGAQSDPNKNYTMQTDNARVFEHVSQTENVPSRRQGNGTGSYRNDVRTEYPGVASNRIQSENAGKEIFFNGEPSIASAKRTEPGSNYQQVQTGGQDTTSYDSSSLNYTTIGKTGNINSQPQQNTELVSYDSRTTESYSESTSSSSESSTSDSSTCICCKRKDTSTFYTLRKKLSQHAYPLCKPCFTQNGSWSPHQFRNPTHICQCYTVVETRTLDEIKKTMNDIDNLDNRKCTCSEDHRRTCKHCSCKLRRTRHGKNGMAYMLTFEPESRKDQKKRKKHKHKRKSLEEIKIKIPMYKKHKDKENKKKRSRNDEKRYNLQEYLKQNRPDFVEEAEFRRRIVLEAKEQREVDMESKKMSFLKQLEQENDNFESQESGQGPPNKNQTRRILTPREILEINRRNYKKLPEVQQRLVDNRQKKLRMADKLIADRFNRKLRDNVLKGKLNLALDVCVV